MALSVVIIVNKGKQKKKSPKKQGIKKNLEKKNIYCVLTSAQNWTKVMSKSEPFHMW